MLSFIKEIFQQSNHSENEKLFNEQQKIQIAAATLFIEIAKADSNFGSDEYKKINDLIKNMFSLSNEQVHEIMELAEDWISRSVSMYEFTDIINKHFTNDEKYELVKNLWKIVYADNVLDKYEEHLVRVISNNLKLSHRDMIAAKLEIKNSEGIK
jgi:uncharacterized tellurite resistance protein B-like protein